MPAFWKLAKENKVKHSKETALPEGGATLNQLFLTATCQLFSAGNDTRYYLERYQFYRDFSFHSGK